MTDPVYLIGQNPGIFSTICAIATSASAAGIALWRYRKQYKE